MATDQLITTCAGQTHPMVWQLPKQGGQVCLHAGRNSLETAALKSSTSTAPDLMCGLVEGLVWVSTDYKDLEVALIGVYLCRLNQLMILLY